MKLIDLTGQKFGRWTALEYTGKSKWKCICECGNIKEVNLSSLKSGKSKSCGCYHGEVMAKTGENIGLKYTGKKFGKLTVISRVRKNGKIKYRCRCECGNISDVGLSNLLGGITKSCGCLKNYISMDRYVDHSGKTFGRLYVIKRIRFSKNGKYLCRCECGKETEVWSYNLTNEHTRSCGCLSIETSKTNNSGKNSSSWKGGVIVNNLALYETYVNQLEPIEKIIPFEKYGLILFKVECKKCGSLFVPTGSQARSRVDAIKETVRAQNNFYCSEECKENCSIFRQHKFPKGYIPSSNRPYVDPYWRKSVLERDNFECQICGSKENLNCHHIYPAVEYPILANDIDNGITLCESCHYQKAHSDDSCKTANIGRCK